MLVLTKPLWLGIITTAAKNDEDKLGAIASAVKVMTTLNRDTMEAIVRVGAHALTDVTGFGLLGHLRNMVVASNVSARVYLDRVPVLSPAWEYVRAGIAPGGTHANHRFLAECVTYAPDLTERTSWSCAMHRPPVVCWPPWPRTGWRNCCWPCGQAECPKRR